MLLFFTKVDFQHDIDEKDVVSFRMVAAVSGRGRKVPISLRFHQNILYYKARKDRRQVSTTAELRRENQEKER